MRCLLIWPPYTSPATVPGCLVSGAVLLAGRGYDVAVEDANLAFAQGSPLCPDSQLGRAGGEALGAPEFFRPARFLAALSGAAGRGRDGATGTSNGGQRSARAEPVAPTAAEYRDFWGERLLPWAQRAAADVVVVLAASDEQEKAAQAAAEVLAGAAGPPVIVARDGRELAAALSPRARLPRDTERAVRVFRDLAGAPYLTPGPVCAFDAFSSEEWLGETVAALTAGGGTAGYLLGADAVGPDPVAWLRQGPLAAAGGTPVSVVLPAGTLLPRDGLESARDAGLRVIRWQWREQVPQEFFQCLMDASAAGVWNHLFVPEGRWGEPLARFAARNPNIVHSATPTPDDPMQFGKPMSPQPAGASGYEGLRPLPGQPFWTALSDPSHLLLYVAELGIGELSRLRVVYPGPEVWPLGLELIYRLLAPSALSQGQLDEMCSMVLSGGAVGGQWVRHNLERAFLVALAEERGVIAGISSLKHPREEYVARVRDKCGLDIRGFLERGYTSVRPEYRGQGLGTRLLEGLTAQAEGRPIFSVIRETDVAAQKMALRNRTRRVATFYSERVGGEVSIWMPEEQLPEGLADPAGPKEAGA